MNFLKTDAMKRKDWGLAHTRKIHEVDIKTASHYQSPSRHESNRIPDVVSVAVLFIILLVLAANSTRELFIWLNKEHCLEASCEAI